MFAVKSIPRNSESATGHAGGFEVRRLLLSLTALACVHGILADGGSLDKPNWRSESLASGVTVLRAQVTVPKALRLSAVRVDLKTPGLRFTGTGRCTGYDQPLEGLKIPAGADMKQYEPAVRRTALETTPAFFERCARPVDQGGRGLDMLVAFGSAQGGPPQARGFACPGGLVISDGVVVSDVSRGRAATLIVRKDGTADLVQTLSPADYPSLAFARSGYTLIRRDGRDVVAPGGTVRGRLAAGLSADRQFLWIVTADAGDLATVTTAGVDYHELNVVFAGLGVTDAAAFSFARNGELVVRDRGSGKGRILNGFDAPSVGVQVNTGIYRVSSKPAKKRESAGKPPVQVKFSAVPRLACVTDAEKARVLRGQVKLAFETDLSRMKRPMLNVIALFDQTGAWRYYDVLCGEPGESGGTLASAEYTTKQYSDWQSEVDVRSWKTVAFGNPRSAFFTGYGISEKAKLLVYRLEVWQAGRLIGEYDSDPKLVKRLGLPDDWYVKGKYRGKIIYKYPPSVKK